MSDSLIQVPFHGDTIEAVAKNDTWMASLRRMCENLGVDYKTQARKLKEKKWAVVVIMPTTGSDGKTYEMAMIDRRTMTMWLAGINPSKVKPELREKIEAYQCEAADALDKYFNEGAAIRFKTNSMDEESLILAKANPDPIPPARRSPPGESRTPCQQRENEASRPVG
ncbi:antirepressor N-terminal domain protein [Bifidobacterium longum subsp. longum 44B]|uniref:phage antirepressor N-terminal domain-containing protein n=1 Tax=Bifidobacterium longum TaxID=216816 RepID=UPI00025E4752|nr:phage antirepressor N-terminal domain-containing protein [Bifidobacterium longum]EIJ30050.1 antirepressor N-terminal domain protein [Bifidobacterium longum subsp. longum 44B]MDM3531610.1 phage antirepressor N-terminal domain-containing protein [Bifidobacterium longum]